MGDSITFGVGDDRQQDLGWPGRLQELFSKAASPLEVVNLGIPGHQIKDLYYQYEQLVQPAHCDEDDILIISVGTNNCHTLSVSSAPSSEHLSISPIQSEIDFTQLIQKIKGDFAGQIIVQGLLPIDEDRMPMASMALSSSEALSPHFKNADLKSCHDMMKRVCDEERILFLDQWDTWEADALQRTHHKDGLHPNTDGYDTISKNIYAFMKKFGVI